MEEMRSSMDSLFRQLSGTWNPALPPASGEPGAMALPVQRSGFRVDVTEHDNDVIVTADLIPGVTKKDISLDLVNPQALEISCERKEEKNEEKEGYYLRERRFGSMTRIVPLPRAVTDEGASASFKNGVLEVRLKKATREPRTKIPVE
jgi:HSP20 family protein